MHMKPILCTVLSVVIIVFFLKTLAYVKVTMEEHVRDTQNMGKDEIIISSLNSWPILTLKLWESCVYLFQISSMLSVFLSSNPILILYTVVLLNCWFYYMSYFYSNFFLYDNVPICIPLTICIFVHSIYLYLFLLSHISLDFKDLDSLTSSLNLLHCVQFMPVHCRSYSYKCSHVSWVLTCCCSL